MITLPPPVFAIAVVLAAAAAGSGDYALSLPNEPPTCAKSQATCEQARVAVRKGWLPDVPRDAPTDCVPAPGCFAPASNFIAGRR